MSFYILCYGMVSNWDSCFASFASLVKIVGKLNVQILNSTVSFIFVSNTLCVLGFWVWGLGAISIWLGFWTAIVTSFLWYWYVLFHQMDWTEVKDPHPEERPYALSPAFEKIMEVAEPPQTPNEMSKNIDLDAQNTKDIDQDLPA